MRLRKHQTMTQKCNVIDKMKFQALNFFNSSVIFQYEIGKLIVAFVCNRIYKKL